MIVDVHTHLWPASRTPPAFSTYLAGRGSVADRLTHEGLLASMETSGISHSVVVAITFDPTMSNDEIKPLNDYVRQEAAKSGGRLTPFCTVNPFEGGESVRSLQRSIEEQGFRGLKLHGSIQEFYPNDRRLYPTYELMQRYGLPILFHSGGIGVLPYRDRYGDVGAFDDVACDFPELPIILGHAGRNDWDATAALLRKHRQVRAEISTNFGRDARSRLEPLKRLFETVRAWAGSTQALLFGSDYPMYGQGETVGYLRELEAAVTSGEVGILEPGDVQRVLDANSTHLLDATTQD